MFANMRHRVTIAVPTPTPSQHVIKGIVVDAPPNLRRFKEGELRNPLLSDEDIHLLPRGYYDESTAYWQGKGASKARELSRQIEEETEESEEED